jgi:hypothetical protein
MQAMAEVAKQGLHVNLLVTELVLLGSDADALLTHVLLCCCCCCCRHVTQAMAEVTKQGLYPNPLVTELVPLGSGADRFWAGEDYHQNYYAENPTQGYCRAVVAPKVSKFRWVCLLRGEVCVILRGWGGQVDSGASSRSSICRGLRGIAGRWWLERWHSSSVCAARA